MATDLEGKWVLFVADEPLLPVRSGGRVETLGEVFALQRGGHRVVVVLPADGPDGELPYDSALHEETIGPDVHSYSRKGSVSANLRWFWLPNVGSRRMINRGDLQWLLSRMPAEPPVVVICAHDFMMPVAKIFAGALNSPPILLRSHNDEFRFLVATARATATPLKRVWRHIDAIRFLVVRRRMLAGVSQIALLSSADAGGYRAHSESLTLLPPILSSRRPDGADNAALRSAPPNSSTILFVGALGSSVTAHGLQWFLDDVWPSLYARSPHLTLRVVGRGAAPSLADRLLSEPGISYGGEVAALEPELRNARVFVNPVLVGSGVNMKMGPPAEAGLPIVTTEVGARGLDQLRSGLLVAQDAREFVAACERLLTDDELWLRLSSSLASGIQAEFSDVAVGAKLNALVESLADTQH